MGVGCHQMPTRAEAAIDHAVRREEPLRLGRGFEPLHVPLSPSRRPMRILSTVVQIPARSVPDIRQDFAMRDTVAAQAVSDQAPPATTPTG